MVLPELSDAQLLPVAFLGMALLGFGAFWRDPRNHFARIAGWMIFGLYWPFKAQHYFDVGDPFNAWFSLAAPLLTGYIAYHEYLSWKWGERPVALTWLAGATFVAATSYFVLFEITPIQETIIYWTGVESAWLTDALFGTQSVAVQDPRLNAEGYHPTHICLAQGYGDQSYASFCDSEVVGAAAAGFPFYAVTIIFACTALQSIMIFVGAIAFTKAPAMAKMKAYAITVPTIYFLNLFRNAGIIYGYRVQGWTVFGLDSFEFMHSYIAKTGAILALVLIALAVFRLLPQLHENILDVLALPKRKPAEPPGPPPGAPAESS